MYARESHTKEFNLTTLVAPELETVGFKPAMTCPPDYELLTDVWLEFKRRGRDARAEHRSYTFGRRASNLKVPAQVGA